jgi:predicted ATP-dependent endonuclease of OLD family
MASPEKDTDENGPRQFNHSKIFNKIDISEFRPIQKEKIELHDDVTVLVGPNEAGKSNILESILMVDRGIIPSRDGCVHLENPQPTVTAELQIPKSKINREFEYIQEEELIEDEPVRIQVISNRGPESEIMGLTEDELRPLHRERSTGYTSLSSLENIQNYLEEMVEEAPTEVWEDMGIDRKFFDNLIINIKEADRQGRYSLNEIGRDIDKLLDNLRKIDFTKSNLSREEYSKLRDIVGEVESEAELFSENLESEFSFPYEKIQELYNIIYIKEVDDIEDEIKIEELQSSGKDSVYQDIFELSDLQLSNSYDIGSRERKKKKEKVAGEIQEGFNKYWTQENVSIELDFGGDTVSLHISDDDEEKDSQKISQRSDGFQRFLSLYINILAKSGGDLEGDLILIDNPGLHLHPKIKKEFRNAIESVAKDNQVVYTTHSPYMIDKQDLEKIRVVSKGGIEEGTKVEKLSEYSGEDGDALKPIRSSIGAEASDSLFASTKNVIVEGYSDRRYLNQMNHLLDEDLFGEPVTFVDAGGSGKTDYYAKIMEAENYDYAILLDSDKGGKDGERKIMKDETIPNSRVHLLHESIREFEDSNASIESMFDTELYVNNVVNAVDEINEDDVVELKDIPNLENKSTLGVLNDFVPDDLKTNTGGNIPENKRIEYIKKEVADEICSRISEGDLDKEDLEKAPERFQELLRDISDKL